MGLLLFVVAVAAAAAAAPPEDNSYLKLGSSAVILSLLCVFVSKQEKEDENSQLHALTILHVYVIYLYASGSIICDMSIKLESCPRAFTTVKLHRKFGEYEAVRTMSHAVQVAAATTTNTTIYIFIQSHTCTLISHVLATAKSQWQILIQLQLILPHSVELMLPQWPIVFLFY